MSDAEPRHLFQVCLASLRDCVSHVSDHELLQPTACTGWRVADLITHLRLGADEVLRGLTATTDQPADRDATSYWSDWPPGPPPGFADVRWLWAQTASYSRADDLRTHFESSARAAQWAGGRAAAGRVAFQSHVMTTDEFVSVWVVEFTVHHLDLLRHLNVQIRPDDEVIQHVVHALEVMTATRRPRNWDNLTFLAKATGREPLETNERALLGDTHRRFPAFG